MADVWWHALLGLAVSMVVVWLALVALLLVSRRGTRSDDLREALRVLPDVVRLLRRLSADPELPRSVRVRLALLLGYLVVPIDLIPDFIPVLGYVDDAVVVALALRLVTRAAGADALARHWPGTPRGLDVVRRLAGISRTAA
ncbi:MAG: YkvA family protein [Nocardioidaceae bacterium]